MANQRHDRNRAGHTLFSRFRFHALIAAPALIAAALLINVALPTSAQSQINGRVVAAPQASAAHAAEKPKLPKAPVQVAMPAPPPMEYMPGLEEPLVATGPVSQEETAALRLALKEFHDAPAKAGPQGDYADYARPLLSFLSAHPQSNWNAAIQTDLGLGYYHAGYWSRAFTAYEKAWALGRNAASPQARLMIDRAVGELAKMHARVGHAKELEALFADIGSRPIGGPATETIAGARSGLWTFRHRPDISYLCGPNALKNVLAALKAKREQIKIADDARSGEHGFTLTQLAALAGKAGLKYTLIARKAGQPIPVPSVIHWNVHHYAAITGMQNGLYHVEDPTFGDTGGLLLTAKAIDAEGSGYFLVPAAAANPKAGWRAVAAHSAEAGKVYGMGNAFSHMAGVKMACDRKMAPTCGCGGSNSAPQNCGNLPPGGMTSANAHIMDVSLNLSDTPVGYVPQKGLSSQTTLTYNQREDMQPANFAFSNVSPKWNHTWMVYVQDDPNHTAMNVTRLGSGGGGYTPTGFNGATGAFAPEMPDVSVLFAVTVGGARNYERHMPDGGKEVYAHSDGATVFPRHLLLTQVVDAQGNTTTLNYDTQHRLTSVVDAMGRSTTFTYGLSGFPLLITRITDPFGRTSQLTYDTSQRLASITDPVGITSSFTYSTTEPTFVTSLTTPYGTSTFSDALNPNDAVESDTRSLTLTDPLGFTDYVYFYQNPSVTPATDPTATIPTGIVADNGSLQYRNSYYWDRHAFALGATTSGGVVQSEDFSKVRLWHWLHQVGILDVSRTLGSSKLPLERRYWYTYINQALHGAQYDGGIFDVPIVKGRVLDDGTSQVTNVTFNSSGYPVQSVDPKGRSIKFNYAANNIDVLTVQQLTTAPSTYTTTATYGSYNALHEPQTATDAAGKVWHVTYNAAGQITSITDPNTGLTAWNYDSQGRIANVVNANAATAISYTYDSADRILTQTDSEGYVLTYAYDALDRVTSITYPDGTADLYDYTFQSGPNVGTPSLELRKHTDRLGRVTTWGYDADRRMTSVTEPTTATTTRTTSYDYYENGTLKNITDANGNVTHWDIDIESRPTSKTYASGTTSAQTETYAYEAASGRLHSVTDALGQVKTFAYDIDDKIKGITYTATVNPTPNVTFTWDSFFPRLKSMADGLGTTNFAYTAIGSNGALKLASIDGPFANDVVSQTHDALGRLAGRNITGGNETFAYDPISRLTSHVTPLGTFATTYLGQTSQTATRSVTNGTTTVSTSWGYDTNTNDRRLISITNSGVTRSYALSYLNGTTIDPYNIAGITDTAAAGHPFATQAHAYGYDLANRLLTANQTFPGNNLYAYDNLDNATTITDSTGTTNPTYNGLNQIQAFGPRSYTYDNNGNTTGDTLRTYKWDAENRLIEIDYVGTTAKSQFSYNALGQRIVDVETPATGSPVTTRYLWCRSRICQTRDGSDTVLRRDLDEGEFNVSTSQKLIYMPDQLGSVRDVLDASTGSLVQSYDFNPYGSVSRSGGTTPTDYQYGGLFFHPQSNLNLATYRAYDGITGRFPNPDPIGEAGGLNRYAYTEASPTMFSDPLGLVVKKCCRGAEILGGGVNHCWLTTDTKSAGMASSPACRADVGNNYEGLYLTKVYISDHSCEKPDVCTTISNADEDCVDKQLQIGKPLGRFSITNNCQKFVNNVIAACPAPGRSLFSPSPKPISR